MTGSLGEAVLDLVGDTTGLARDLASAGKMAESRLMAIGQKMTQAGANLTRSLTLPILGVGVAAGKMSMDFETSMQHVAGLVGKSQTQVDAWSKELLRLGPELGKSPKELAEALYFVTSAGIDSSKAIDVVVASAKAASAGLGETQTVAQAVSAALNAYAGSNLDASQATAILVATVREGTGEANEIAPALGRVIPIAAQMGIGFDQVGAAMAAMTLTGSDAAEASTNLSGVMSAFLKPSKQAQDALGAYGLSAEGVRDSIEKNGLLSALDMLRQKIGDDDEALAAIFPNIRGFRAVLSLTGENAAQTAQIFKNLAGTTEADLNNAFESVTETGAFKFKQAMSQMQGLLIVLGNAIIPAVLPIIKDLSDTAKRLADGFASLSPEVQKSIIVAAGLVAALGPLLTVGGNVAKTIGGLAGIFSSFGGSLIEFIRIAALAKNGTELFKFALSSAAVQLGILAAGLLVAVKFFEAASKAAKATNAELLDLAKSNTGNVIEDTFTRAGASFELVVNGSKRLKDEFIGHQDEMRDKLLAGETTLEDYNTEIERSAKVAGVWSTQFVVGTGNVVKIDDAVKVLTASDVRMEEAMRDATIADEALAASLTVTSGGMGDLKDATDPATQATLNLAEAQKAAAAENEVATAQLDRLRALIDGQVGPAYADYSQKTDEVTAKQQALREELAKLEASQGSVITTQKKHALSVNELELAQLKLAAAQTKLSETTDPLKQAALAVEIDKLTEKIGGASGATTSWVDNSKRIGEINGELGELDLALQANATAYDERLKRILFDMAAEQLAVGGLTEVESEALIALALKFGLVDQATADMQMSVLAATQKMAEDQNVPAFINTLDALEKKAVGTNTTMTTSTDTMVGRLKESGQDYDDEMMHMALKADEAAARATSAREAEVTAFIKGTSDIGVSIDEEAIDMARHTGEINTSLGTVETKAGVLATAVSIKTGEINTSFSGMGTRAGEVATTMSTKTGAIQTSFDTMMRTITNTVQHKSPGMFSPIETAAGTMQDRVQGIIDDLLGAISSLFSKLGNAKNQTSSATGGGSTPANRAIGGRVWPGMSYIVGERRPELFEPDVPGRIIPNVRSATSTVTNQYNLTAQYSVQDERSLRDDVRMMQMLAG